MAGILVVDDELFYREMLADILGKKGHQVFTAKEAKEAINLVKTRGDIDLALLDIVMPGMDGILLLSKLKNLNPSLPVIMLTAHEDQRMVIQALRRGAFDYQKKPISRQELELSVERALRFSRLERERERKLERLSCLENGAKQLSEMVAGEIPLQALAREYELLDSAVKLVAELLQCERVSIMLLDPEDHLLKVAVSHGMSKKLIKEETRPAGKSVSSYVLETGKALLVRDVSEDDRVSESEYSHQYQTKSFVIAPIRLGRKLVGTINANDKKSREPFDEEDLFMLKTLSYHVSASLAAAVHISELAQDRERLRRLTELQKILINCLEPGQMMKDLIKQCQQMMNVVSAAVFLVDDFSGDLALKTGFNGNREMTKSFTIPAGQSITGLAAAQGKIFVLNAPEKDPRFVADLEWPYQGTIRNLLAAPLKVSKNTIGVIRLLNKRDGHFTRADGELMRDVAASLSIAIRNMKLYEQLNQSVEEIIAANRRLQAMNDQLKMKARELALLKKAAAGGNA